MAEINEMIGYIECCCGHKEQVLVEVEEIDPISNQPFKVLDWDNAATNEKIYNEHCLKCDTWREKSGLEPL